jgi:alkanesulfonate monooxygenase SsuD/methylene tetrahydromethanopterin reductase-like flavin-dependent oxidoreductase (luciferase family)
MYFAALRQAGHAVAEKDVFVMYPAYVGDSDAEAQAEVIEHWNRWREFALQALGLDPSKGEPYRHIFSHLDYQAMVRDNRGVFGGPETCLCILRNIVEIIGPTQIGLVFHFGGLSQAKVLKSMERFARIVAPKLRNEVKSKK